MVAKEGIVDVADEKQSAAAAYTCQALEGLEVADNYAALELSEED